jgi:hypothetical protein
VLATLRAGAKVEKHALTDLSPTLALRARGEGRRAIGITIQHVELVCELVIDEVVPVALSLAVA